MVKKEQNLGSISKIIYKVNKSKKTQKDVQSGGEKKKKKQGPVGNNSLIKKEQSLGSRSIIKDNSKHQVRNNLLSLDPHFLATSSISLLILTAKLLQKITCIFHFQFFPFSPTFIPVQTWPLSLHKSCFLQGHE